MENENNNKPNVLVVDDNVVLLRIVKDMLKDDFNTAIAASSAQAFMAIAKKKPDIILLDYEMPIVDGESTMKMLREDETLADIPVIFLTSIAETEVVAKLLALKPAGYILKPPNKEKMIELLHKTIKDKPTYNNYR